MAQPERVTDEERARRLAYLEQRNERGELSVFEYERMRREILGTGGSDGYLIAPRDDPSEGFKAGSSRIPNGGKPWWKRDLVLYVGISLAFFGGIPLLGLVADGNVWVAVGFLFGGALLVAGVWSVLAGFLGSGDSRMRGRVIFHMITGLCPSCFRGSSRAASVCPHCSRPFVSG